MTPTAARGDLPLGELARLKELELENQELRRDGVPVIPALDYREGAAMLSKWEYIDSLILDPPVRFERQGRFGLIKDSWSQT